jgi:hypothetical protein
MLMLHPDVQKRVQEELDEQVGDGRLPNMKDIEKMRYFRATWNESLRFNVTTPLGTSASPHGPIRLTFAPTGVPHVTTEPDVYRGYYIPKGCVIYYNLG